MRALLVSLLALAALGQTPAPTRLPVARVNGALTSISGTPAAGHCASFLNSSTIQDAGSACGGGGGGGTGASQTAQLIDWAVTRTSSTLLTFGSACLPAAPCNVSIGGVVTPFTGGPYTTSISGSGTGSIYIYVSNVGALSTCFVAASGSITVTPGTGVTGTTCASAPSDIASLVKWDIASGALNSSGSALASYLSYKPSPLGGAGMAITPGPRDTIAIDTTAVVRKFSCAGGPGSTLPAGATQGDYCEDYAANPVVAYVCANIAGCSASGDFKVFTSAVSGTTILYRCSVAGTLRIGQTTTVSGDCGTAVDTGLRVN